MPLKRRRTVPPTPAVELADVPRGNVGIVVPAPSGGRDNEWVRTHPGLIGIAMLAVLFLRRPQMILDPAFVYEDGKVFFFEAWQSGLGSLNNEYGGNLHLVPRLIALLEQVFPIAYAPLIGSMISLAIVAAIAAYIASDALANAVPDRRIRLVLALIFVLLPNTEMSLGRPTFLQFYLGVLLVATAVAARAGPPTLAAIAACSLTGPFGLLLSPLYAARAWLVRDRDSLLRLAALGIPAILQALVLLGSGRSGYMPPPTTDPEGIARILGGHLIIQFIGGRYVVEATAYGTPFLLTAGFALGLAGLAIAAARHVDRRELVVLGIPAVATIGAALLLGSAEREHFLNPLSAARYFLIPGAMLATLIVLAASRGSRAGIALVLVMAVGLAGDFRLQTPNTFNWPAESACLGGPVACYVPIYPGEGWEIIWIPPGWTGPLPWE